MSTIVTPPSEVSRSEAALRRRRRGLGRKLGPYLFLLPATLFLAIFLLYPLFTMLLFSFQQVNVGGLLTGNTPFVGLDNYRTVLSDATFRSSLGVSLLFT
ncbi:MAG: sugar ABC transporter permease, partial [Ktedonobacteraceae bacterium]|nr:sugar ABC transporter permease [Ktedonobacteraceae bacterium]